MANSRTYLRDVLERGKRAQAVLLASIVAAGGRWSRKTTLWKAFWWAHLECMKQRGAELTDHQIVRLPHGPAPNDGDSLLNELERAGLVQQGTDGSPRHTADTFAVPDQDKAREWTSRLLSKKELEIIESAARKFSGMTSKEASDFSHEFSAEWKRQENGRVMNIYGDLVPEDKVASAFIRSREASNVLEGLFSQQSKPTRKRG